MKDGDGKLALAVLKLFEKDCSKEAWFQLRLGEACSLTGDREAAHQAFRKAAELLPGDKTISSSFRPVMKYMIDQGLKESAPPEQPKKNR